MSKKTDKPQIILSELIKSRNKKKVLAHAPKSRKLKVRMSPRFEAGKRSSKNKTSKAISRKAS